MPSHLPRHDRAGPAQALSLDHDLVQSKCADDMNMIAHNKLEKNIEKLKYRLILSGNLCIFEGKRCKDGTNLLPGRLDGPEATFAQQVFQFGEELFDEIKVRIIDGQEEQPGFCSPMSHP